MFGFTDESMSLEVPKIGSRFTFSSVC